MAKKSRFSEAAEEIMNAYKGDAHHLLRQDPVFLVGYPRSGTTLLQALLATQGGLVTFPETHFFSILLARDGRVLERYDVSAAREIMEQVIKISRLDLDPAFVDGLKDRCELSGKGLFEELVARLLPEDARVGSRWIEKTPGHVTAMAQIHLFYPAAKFVGIVRNPLHAVYSRHKYFPEPGNKPIETAARLWVEQLQALERFKEEHLFSAYIVRYEDMVRDPSGTIESICQFLGVTYAAEQLVNYRQKAMTISRPFESGKRTCKNPKSILEMSGGNLSFPCLII